MKKKLEFQSPRFCVFHKVLAFGICLFGSSLLEAREWTSRDGKKIEAEFVELKGESVVLEMKGKKLAVPLSKLSDEDAEYARAEGENPSSRKVMVAGNELTPGVKSTFIVDFNEAEKKMVKKPGDMPMQVRMTFILHPDFDPKKENKIFFARTTHSDKDERGDMREMGRFEEATRKYGWHLAAFDSPKGLMRNSELEVATFAAGLRVMEEAWPGCSQKWKFGAGGNSGGAKTSQYLMAILHRLKVKPYALFLNGCNGFMGIYFRDSYKVSPSILSNVRVVLANGISDDISTIAHAEKVYEQLKKEGRVKNLRFVKYEGGHESVPEEVDAAFKWFDDPSDKK